MKGKKMVFAVMLSLIVCLLLVPTCAYATEVEPVEENSDAVVLPTLPDGDASKVPAAPVVIGDLDGDDTADAPVGGDDDDDTFTPDTDEDDGDADSTIPGDDDDTNQEPGSDEGDKDTTHGDSDDDDKDESKDENEDDKDKPANNNGAPDNHTPSGNTPSGNGGNGGSSDYKGFQVELTYNDKVVKKEGLKGGESFDLAELLRELGIDGEITEAKGNADDLFDAVNGEDGWKFNTKMAFGDPYQLVVTVDGVRYVIDVTDDGNVVDVNAGDRLQDKIKNAADGSIIKLNSDFREDLVIESGKTITIDLNGHTLYSVKSHSIVNNGSLTIIGSGKIEQVTPSEGGNYYHGIVNYGELTFNGDATVTTSGWYKTALLNVGTATINNGTFSTTGGISHAWYVIKNLGDLTINSGKVTKDTKETGLVVNGWDNSGKWPEGFDRNDCAIEYSGKDASLTINGGTFENGAFSVKNMYKTKLIIKDGTFTGAGNYNVYSESAVEVSGGTFNSDGNNFLNSRDGGAGTLTIKGGTFTAGKGESNIIVWGKPDTIITGGTFNADNLLQPSKGNAQYGGNATISGGSINAGLTAIPRDQWTNLNLTVKGGVFTDESVKDFVGENDVIVEKDGKIYVNTPVPTANTIALTSDAHVFKYMVVEGKDQTWTKSANSDALNYVLNADAKNLVKVLIDGEEVEFEIDENGEVVISAEVLEKLEAGEYEIEFIFADGSCKTKLFVK